MKTIDIATVVLSQGSHSSPVKGMCVMEAVVTPIFTEPKFNVEPVVKLWEDKRAGRMDKPPSSNRSRTP